MAHQDEDGDTAHYQSKPNMVLTGAASSVRWSNEPLRGLRQQRLSRYWSIPERSLTNRKTFPFMALPPAVRGRIYEYLDVPVGRFISLNYVPKAATRHVTWTLNHPDEICPPDASEYYDDEEDEWRSGEFSGLTQILLVCKTICEEVRSMLFSENMIAVSQRRFGGLQVFEDIGPVAWREMRSLIVLIQACSCMTSYCTNGGWPAMRIDLDDSEDEATFVDRSYYKESDESHRRPLCATHPYDQEGLRQWERICSRLAAHAQSHSLRLFLVCDLEDVELAERAVRPLFSLPRLRGVSISFGEPAKNMEALRQLARETVRTLSSKPREDRPFRFLDLPVELQLSILRYTNLLPRGIGTVFIQLGGAHWHSWEMDACGTYRATSEVGSKFARLEILERHSEKGNFCSGERAASSPACECFPVPISWFRVSRQFADVARTAYYSYNEFVIHGWRERNLSAMYPSTNADEDRCAPECFRNFLRHHTADSVWRIRKLILIFPPMNSTYLTPNRRSWPMWLETIELLATRADVPRMELTICIANHICPPEPDGNDYERFKGVGAAEEAEMREAYRQIITPMKRLSDLHTLFIHIPWPFRDGLQDERRADEEMLERIVMGESYDSRKHGKPLDTFWCQPGFIDWWN